MLLLFVVSETRAQNDILIPRKNEDGLYGYVNQYGKEKIDYQYQYAGAFHKGYAVVMQQDSFYYINPKGEFVSQGYELAYPFIDNYTIVSKGNKFAFIDTSFNSPRDRWFEEAYFFQRGYAIGKTSKNKFILNEEGRMSRVSNNYNIPVKSEKVHEVVETMPYFPGGDVKMQEYIRKHISLDSNIPLIYVAFRVEKDGHLKEVSVMGNVDKKLKKQIKQLFDEMPPWVPGRKAGDKVRVKMNMPISVNQED